MGLSLVYFDDDAIQSGVAELASVKVLYIQHTRAEDREQYVELFKKAKQANPNLIVIAFQANTQELFRSLGIADVLTLDNEAPAYYGNTTENLRGLLRYTGAKYLNREWSVEPPEKIDQTGLYTPDNKEFFKSAEEFLLWQRATRKIRPEQPRLLIAVHGTHLAFQQPAVVDALIREAEKQGAVAVAIVDGRSRDYELQVRAFDPSAIIHTCHSSDSIPFRLDIDVPHLHSIFLRKQSIQQYQQSVDGLAGSELAFHVIGQELIGAIEPQIGEEHEQGKVARRPSSPFLTASNIL